MDQERETVSTRHPKSCDQTVDKRKNKKAQGSLPLGVVCDGLYRQRVYPPLRESYPRLLSAPESLCPPLGRWPRSMRT